MRVSVCLGAILIPEYLDFHPALLLPGAELPEYIQGYPKRTRPKSVSEKKSRGLRTSKIVKFNQRYRNGHLPYHCSRLARALDAWRGMWVFVRSKDAH